MSGFAQFSRASTAYIGDTPVAANVPRFTTNGILLEEGTTNLLGNGTSITAATTVAVTSGSIYSVSCRTGTIVLSGAGTGMVTADTPVTITASGTSLTLTPSGTATYVQVENKHYATSYVTGSRAMDNLTVPIAGIVDASEWTIEFDYIRLYQPNEDMTTQALSPKILQIGNYLEYNSISIWCYQGYIRILIRTSGTSWDYASEKGKQINIDTKYKISVSHINNIFILYVDGKAVFNFSTTNSLSSMRNLQFSNIIVSGFINAMYSNLRVSSTCHTADKIASDAQLDSLLCEADTACLLPLTADLYSHFSSNSDNRINAAISYHGDVDTYRNVLYRNDGLTDVYRNARITLSGNIDTLLDVHRAPWRYINPGYAELLEVAGNTVTDSTANPDNGVAFYTTLKNAMITMPAVKTLYINFDFYMASSVTFRAYNTDNGATGFRTNGSNAILVFINDSQTKTINSLSLIGHHSMLVAIVSDATAGSLNIFLDDKNIYTYTGNVAGGKSLLNNYIQSDNNNALISNVILSDMPIATCEKVKILPTKSATGWTDNGDGTYSTDTVGNTLTQAVDMTGLSDVGITGLSANIVGASYEGDTNAVTTGIAVGGKNMGNATKAVTAGIWSPALTRVDTGEIIHPTDLMTADIVIKAANKT